MCRRCVFSLKKTTMKPEDFSFQQKMALFIGYSLAVLLLSFVYTLVVLFYLFLIRIAILVFLPALGVPEWVLWGIAGAILVVVAVRENRSMAMVEDAFRMLKKGKQ